MGYEIGDIILNVCKEDGCRCVEEIELGPSLAYAKTLSIWDGDGFTLREGRCGTPIGSRGMPIGAIVQTKTKLLWKGNGQKSNIKVKIEGR